MMNTSWTSFDSLHSEFSGTTLVEAAAGTGKTYNIQNLAARAVMEGYDFPSLLIVTYTEAAADELKKRCFSILKGCYLLLDRHLPEDAQVYEQCKAIVETEHIERKIPTELLKYRLHGALLTLDSASIFTIHGFCMRVLSDCAFESGNLFRTRLEANSAVILSRLSDDYYRHVFYSDAISDTVKSILRTLYGITNLTLYERIRGPVSESYTPVQPLQNKTEKQEHPYGENLFSPEDILALESLIDEIHSFSRNQTSEELLNKIQLYGKAILRDAVQDFRTAIQQCEKHSRSGRSLLLNSFLVLAEKTADLRNFTKAALSSHPDLEQEFLLIHQYRQKILEVTDRLYYHFLCRGIHEVRSAYEKLKEEENFLTFDDLLLKVREILRSSGSERLLTVLRQRYRMAIIDEFQDTDPCQYEIFHKIFAEGGLPVFLIGDPRQAIYSFRGADIATYTKAARDVEMCRPRQTLSVNYRSADVMIQAVNTLFRLPQYACTPDGEIHSWTPFMDP